MAMLYPTAQWLGSTYMQSINEKYFPDPSIFRPERFLSNNVAAKDSVGEKYNSPAFSPFSIGTRGCVGKALAYMEISLAVARTLWYFDFEEHLEDQTQDRKSLHLASREFKIYDQLIVTHVGPHLIFSTLRQALKFRYGNGSVWLTFANLI